MEHIWFCGPSFIKQKSAQRDLLVTKWKVLMKILTRTYLTYLLHGAESFLRS